VPETDVEFYIEHRPVGGFDALSANAVVETYLPELPGFGRIRTPFPRAVESSPGEIDRTSVAVTLPIGVDVCYRAIVEYDNGLSGDSYERCEDVSQYGTPVEMDNIPVTTGGDFCLASSPDAYFLDCGLTVEGIEPISIAPNKVLSAATYSIYWDYAGTQPAFLPYGLTLKQIDGVRAEISGVPLEPANS